MNRNFQPLLFLCLLSSFVSVNVLAEDAPKKPWKNEIELSFVSANGNTKSTTSSGKNKFTYDWSRASLELFASGLGSKSDGSVTAEQYNAGEKVSYRFTKKNYVFEQFLWLKDRFAGIRSRYDSSVGLGREFFATDVNKLLGEFGTGWIKEERINSENEDFTSGRTYIKYTRTLSPTANFSQDAEFIVNFEDSDDFRSKTETALTAALTTTVSLKVSYEWKHSGMPPQGFSRNDTLTKISLIAAY